MLNKKKKFGIDIDDTLIKVWEQNLFDIHNEKYNLNLKFDDVKTHDFNGDENLKNSFFEYFYENHSSLKLFDGVKEKLDELKEKYDLYLITSRPIGDIELTKYDINNLFGEGYFIDIIFTAMHNGDKKCELANKIGFSCVIDDANHHIENYINNTNIEKIIIFDQPWNRTIEEDNNRVCRIKNWGEISI